MFSLLKVMTTHITIVDTWSFQQRYAGQQAGHNPLRIHVTTEAEELFDNDPRHKGKALLLDLTIVNPCVSSNFESAARQTGKHLADAVERKKNKHRGLFPATNSLLPLAMPTCGDLGPDVPTLIKELAR